MSVRVRYAPSPTGFNHSGGIRTALYNYLFARKYGGDFILRIEDTDQKRFVPGAEQYIKDTLEWCGIMPDESPWKPNPKYGNYRQSERKYIEYAYQLVNQGKAYFAFDTEEEIKAVMEEIQLANNLRVPPSYNHYTRSHFRNFHTLTKEECEELVILDAPFVVRLNVPADEKVTVYDEIRGEITFDTSNMDDKILLKADGTPTYHFASVVDDHLMEITHVLRGDEWLNSYPFHKLIYEGMGWDMPKFIHLPTVLNPDGKGKLSKRTAASKGFEIFPLEVDTLDEKDNAVHFYGYKNKGYERLAYVNFLALLGHTFSKDVLTMDEMIHEFSFDKLHVNPAIFDTSKLEHINKGHLALLPAQRIWEEMDYPQLNRGYTEMIWASILPRLKTRLDIPYFVYPFFYHEKTADIEEETKNLLNSLIGSRYFKFEEEVIKDWIDRYKVNKKDLREVVCSGRSGSDLLTVIMAIGEDEFCLRAHRYLDE